MEMVLVQAGTERGASGTTTIPPDFALFQRAAATREARCLTMRASIKREEEEEEARNEVSEPLPIPRQALREAMPGCGWAVQSGAQAPPSR